VHVAQGTVLVLGAVLSIERPGEVPRLKRMDSTLKKIAPPSFSAGASFSAEATSLSLVFASGVYRMADATFEWRLSTFSMRKVCHANSIKKLHAC
jgi:hypothetical protein